MPQATPKPLTPAQAAETDACEALENACIAALERLGVDHHLDERGEIALAKEILAGDARFRFLSNVRDRLRLIVQERCDAE